MNALPSDFDAFQPRHQVPLAPYTTFKIGGPADHLIEPRTIEQLAEVITLARRHQIPFHVLGCGANILVGDQGVRGLVIINRSDAVQVRGNLVTADSGVLVYPDLIDCAVEAGLSGLEHYVGIPSTVGGALWQNLHFLSPKRDRTMFIEEVLAEATVLMATGEIATVPKEYFQFGYDYSVLHDNEDIVLTATFRLEPEDAAVMRATMAANLAWRAERHPPLDTEPSAGSIFKKIEGIGAGRLIDQCGLKGTRVGGAEITQRHANILINTGGARAADVQGLIAFIRTTVARETGYQLETEIGMIGVFDPINTVITKAGAVL